MAEQATDQELVERVQSGDKRAFDLLVLKYQHKIVNLISRYLRDSNDVQDVAQEAFIKAYRALPRFRGDSAFYTWLYRIVLNLCYDHLRRAGRAKTVDYDDQKNQSEGALIPKILDSNPRHTLERKEILKMVQTGSPQGNHPVETTTKINTISNRATNGTLRFISISLKL